MNESDTPKQDLNVDGQIKQATKKGASTYLVIGSATVIVLVCFFLWLLVVKAHVLIINPDEIRTSAKITLSDGIGIVSKNKVYLFGNNGQVAINADRFEQAVVTINELSPPNIEVILIPSPAIISAELTNISGESTWFVDDQLIHVGDTFEHSLPPGSYLVSLKNAFYEVWQQEIVLERAEQRTLSIDLKPIEGSLNIQSIPLGARIVLNGVEVGKTPYVSAHQGGLYTLSLQSDGFEKSSDEVQVTGDEPNPSRQYLLVPKKAHLTLNLSPKGGLLLVNGQNTERDKLSLAAAQTHEIRYSKDGYRTFQKSVSLNVGQTEMLDISLQPKVGSVTFTSNLPSGLFIDGQAQGTTPLTLSLQSLEKKAEFRLNGYRSVVQTFTSKDKQAITVNATMLTEFDARRAEGRPLFVSTLGIEMVSFRPDAFTMGSPANEVGRKRDEHQVKVDFSRPIWVSRHEVTQAQFSAFDATKPKSNKPVTGVAWIDAAKYCNWLSQNEGLTPFYRISNNRLIGFNSDSKGYRLPTEAEWEWLAKKANRVKATQYVWGSRDRLPKKVANFADSSAKSSQKFVLQDYDDGFPGVAPVASFKADRIGLFDLAGNVQEWVNDYYTNRTPDLINVQIDYLGAKQGQQFVVKGASFKTGKLRELRASLRTIGEGPRDDLGFRIARYN